MTTTSNDTQTKPLISLSNGAYDKLKATVQYILPGLATLYVVLAQFWAFPKPEAVVGTLTAIATFLGIIIAISSRGYNTNFDGAIVVDTTGEADTYSLEFNTTLEELAAKQSVTLEVKQKAITSTLPSQ